MHKKIYVFLMLAILFLLPVINLSAADYPAKYSDSVANVNDPYTPSGWIVSPDDGLATYVKVDNAPECDIKGIISCYDKNSLRVDILLKHPISYDVKVWYAIKIEYTDLVEYYTYYPETEDLVYEQEKDGKVIKTESLKGNDLDYTGVTDSGDVKNTDVYIIINKDKHIDGTVGQMLYLVSSFYSGYVDEAGKLHVADTTNPVNLYFKR